MQLIIFANAATLEVRNISIIYYNEDVGWYSNELIARIQGSPFFKNVYRASSTKELENAIDNQKAIVGLIIQSDFSRLIGRNNSPDVQIILDGRKSNSSQIVQGYLLRIIKNFNHELLSINNKYIPAPNSVFRSWFNPNLDYVLYTVPHLVGILSMIMGLIITALSVARERESGTFDQLLVSPLSPLEILCGKMCPALIIGIIESTLMMIIAMIFYHIPFKGNLFLFYLSLTVFIISIVGIGLFISSLSQTQQQATLGVFVFIMPTILLSGFATPIENMPTWLQPVTWFIPISHLFVIIKGLFLKNMSTVDVLSNIWPMLLIGLVTLSFSVWMFKRKLS